MDPTKAIRHSIGRRTRPFCVDADCESPTSCSPGPSRRVCYRRSRCGTDELAEVARHFIGTMVERARATAPSVKVDGLVLTGSPSGELLRAATGAVMLVGHPVPALCQGVSRCRPACRRQPRSWRVHPEAARFRESRRATSRLRSGGGGPQRGQGLTQARNGAATRTPPIALCPCSRRTLKFCASAARRRI
jgi:hypothetical protein